MPRQGIRLLASECSRTAGHRQLVHCKNMHVRVPLIDVLKEEAEGFRWWDRHLQESVLSFDPQHRPDSSVCRPTNLPSSCIVSTTLKLLLVVLHYLYTCSLHHNNASQLVTTSPLFKDLNLVRGLHKARQAS